MAAPLTPLHGTLVCRGAAPRLGTTVLIHCIAEMTLNINCSIYAISGPGQYDVEAAKKAAAARVRQSALKRQSSFKGSAVSSKSGSKTSSTSSLYTEVDEGVSFKTPSKRNVPSYEEHKLKQKYEQACLLYINIIFNTVETFA